MATDLLQTPLYAILLINQIRVLQIMPGDSEVVKCTMYTVELDTKPSYNALSYTWGEPLPPDPAGTQKLKAEQTIHINNIPKLVTHNLYDALRKLRSQSLARETPIWIDAVCINQADLDEKAVQVANMDQIYSGASTVYAWVGEEDEHTEQAIHVLKYLATIPQSAYTTHKMDPMGNLSQTHPRIKNEDWAAFVVFMHRNYFTRVWIIQEVTLASHIILLCGNKIIPSKTIRPALTYLVKSQLWLKLAQFTPAFIRELNPIASGSGAVIQALAKMDPFTIAEGQQLTPKFKLVSMVGRGLKATDARDFIYGTYGLVKRVLSQSNNTSNVLFPEINYSENVIVKDVHIRWAHFMLNKDPGQEEDYWLLTMVEDRSVRHIQNVPSWVPDQSTGLLPATLGLAIGHGETIWIPSGFRWDGRPSGQITSASDPAKIRTPAAYFGTIEAVGVTWDEVDRSHNFLKLLDILTDVAWPYNDPLDALARSLTADSRDHHQTSAFLFTQWVMHLSRTYNDHAATGRLYRRLAALTKSTDENPLKVPPMESWASIAHPSVRILLDELREFDHRFTLVTGGRRLFRTKDNHLGIGSESIKEGDEAWIMPNSPVLFILRRVGGQSFQLMGSSYVHGIMLGEAARKGLQWSEVELV